MATRTVGHTPGVLETSVNGAGEWDVCREGGGDMIADLSGCDNGKANAARIVLTWNCHDGLVAACEGAVEAITRGLELGDAGKWQDAEIWLNNARGYLEEALAKAEPEGN